MKHKIAVVLDILGPVLPNNVPGSLRQLKEMGCSGVEMGGYYGNSAREMADLLAEAGLQTVALHRSSEDFKDVEKLENAMEEARILGTKDLVFPWLTPENRTEEGYALLKEQLRTAARIVAECGFYINYHNHDFELENKVKGMTALDFMVGSDNEQLIFAEFDTYWIAKGGFDPLAFITRYPNRVRSMHLKDMTADERKTYTELGQGTIDFPPIITWGEQNGVNWYVIEQDICPGNPWDSVRISLDYLHGLKF